MRRTLIAVGVGATLLGAVTAGVSRAAAPSLVVQGDYKIGAYAVKTNGTLHGAIQAFGRPTRVARAPYGTCDARWSAIGVRISFYNLGGRDPCAPQWGYFSQALITGRMWRTSKGLRIGDPSRKMYALYRPSRFDGQWVWLLTRSTRADCAAPSGICRYPGLEAKVLRGWVVAFRVNYAAGGV